MNQYIFLFSLAFLFTLFASIQDLKSREVANWLNFSLIAFALAFRAFFAIQNHELNFFLLGLCGLAIFVALAYAFYYGKIFAGGDAKLLMAFGIILPYKSYSDLIQTSVLFIFLLLLVGAVYSLLYSLIIVTKNKSKFKSEFSKVFSKNKSLVLLTTVLSIILFLLSFLSFLLIPFALLLLTPLLFAYTKSLEKCMLVLTHYSKLTEGDWIENDIKLSRNLTVKKTVHGLSSKDLIHLRKYKKSIIVKQGIPFVPAFLFALIIMALFSLTSEFSLLQVLSFLSSS